MSGSIHSKIGIPDKIGTDMLGTSQDKIGIPNKIGIDILGTSEDKMEIDIQAFFMIR